MTRGVADTNNYRESEPQPCSSELSAGSPPRPSELSSVYDMATLVCKALGSIGCSPSALMEVITSVLEGEDMSPCLQSDKLNDSSQEQGGNFKGKSPEQLKSAVFM